MEKPWVARFLIYFTNAAYLCILMQCQVIVVGGRRFGSVNHCVNGEVSVLIFLKCN